MADENTAGGRLQRLRLDADLSQDDVASVLGVTRPMISKYEDGLHDMSPAVLERAARRFDVTPSFILFGENVVFARRHAPIVGRVGAGAIVEAIQEAVPDVVEVPVPMTGASAYRVDGDSCFPVFEHKDILVVRGEPRFDQSEAVNHYCVVEVERPGSARLGFIKMVRKAAKPLKGVKTFDLESPNAEPIRNALVLSARPVTMRLIGGQY